MGKLTFIAGLAAGYVLGARAGRQRYEQIARTSGKVWNSGPVQKQVSTAKEVARTKAAPVVADMVADAARATGEKLRSSKTVLAEAIGSGGTEEAPDPTTGSTTSTTGSTTGSTTAPTPPAPTGSGADPWAAATSRTDGAA